MLRSTSRGAFKLVMIVAAGVAVLIIDQLTKAWITANMVNHEIRPIIQGFARLRYTENSGAAFGLFQGWTGVLSIAAVAIIAALVISASRMGAGNPALTLAMGLVLGGAIGNLSDRLTLGFVRDFIEVYGPRLEFKGTTYTWPIFNIADSAITIGMLIIMATLIFGKHETTPADDKPVSAPPPYKRHSASPWFRGLDQD